MGFFTGGLAAILVEKGAHFSELGALSLATFPFAIKIFFAPILDTVFHSKCLETNMFLVFF